MRFAGVLWKQPSTHFRRLFTGESSTFGSALVTQWTARKAWNRITGLAGLVGKLSTLCKLKLFLVCSWVSVFDWMFSFLSSASVKQIKRRREFLIAYLLMGNIPCYNASYVIVHFGVKISSQCWNILELFFLFQNNTRLRNLQNNTLPKQQPWYKRVPIHSMTVLQCT